jgi:hypothetical protein
MEDPSGDLVKIAGVRDWSSGQGRCVQLRLVEVELYGPFSVQ